MTTPKRILVTGGCGYIGSLLIRKLHEKHPDSVIRILDNMSTGSYEALANLPEEGHYQFLEGDILNPAFLEAAVKNIDVVIHLASLAKTPLSFDNPRWAEQVNHWGTAHLINASIDAEVKHFIFTSSASVYGPGTNFKETDQCQPLGVYADSKFKAEQRIEVAAKRGLRFTNLRLGTVYGITPVTRYESFINKLALSSFLRKYITIFGDGKQKRPIIHANDVVKSIIKTILDEDYMDENINVLEKNISINEFASVLKNHQKDVAIHYTDQDVRTHYNFEVNANKMQEKFGNTEYDLNLCLKEFKNKFRYFEKLKIV